MNTSVRNLVLAVSILSATGCATPIAPTSLSKPSTTDTITIKNDYVFPIAPGDNNKIGLAAGTYQPEYEDNEGTFYRGPGKCVINMLNLKPTTKAMREDGGLWVARSTGPAKYRIYHYQGTMIREAVEGTSPVQPAANSEMIALSARAPVAAGVGSGIGNAIVQGIVESEKGTLSFFPYQPNSAGIEAVIAPTSTR